MMKKVSFNFKHGIVEGMYCEATDNTAPLAIITPGQNEFYSYGMFPYMQQTLMAHNISSLCYNFSHGGIQNGSEHFSGLQLMQKNCMRLETKDLYCVIRHLPNSEVRFTQHTPLYLIAHSLGSIPTLFAAQRLLHEDYSIHGIVLISPANRLNIWPESMLEKWEKKGVYYLYEERTHQQLPLGEEFLLEVQRAEVDWNLRSILQQLPVNFLLLQGELDESIPVEETREFFDWLVKARRNAELEIIPGADHTYNTTHPLKQASSQLEALAKRIIQWMHLGKFP